MDKDTRPSSGNHLKANILAGAITFQAKTLYQEGGKGFPSSGESLLRMLRNLLPYTGVCPAVIRSGTFKALRTLVSKRGNPCFALLA